REWTRRNRDAVLAADRGTLAEIAREFEAFIVRLLDERRRAAGMAHDDVTTKIMRMRVNDKPLSDADLASIFRNWTVGEVGSMAAALGILADQIARSPELQRTLREVPALIPAAIEELLR